MDIGNPFRFAQESSSVEVDWFEHAYRAAGGQLSPQWREQSIFADLLARVTF